MYIIRIFIYLPSRIIAPTQQLLSKGPAAGCACETCRGPASTSPFACRGPARRWLMSSFERMLSLFLLSEPQVSY